MLDKSLPNYILTLQRKNSTQSHTHVTEIASYVSDNQKEIKLQNQRHPLKNPARAVNKVIWSQNQRPQKKETYTQFHHLKEEISNFKAQD